MKMFLRKIKELESLVKSSRKSLKIAERKIQEKNELISKYDDENNALYQENKDLRLQTELISRISKLLNMNKYNNEKAILNKLKELVDDYQSIN